MLIWFLLITLELFAMPFGLKERLDHFFSKKRVTFNEKSLKEAGFSNYRPREFTRLIVAKHPAFPGLIFKIYLDVQRYYHSKPEHYFFKCRVEGANLIREEIEKKGWQDYFKVPHKWLYTLPKYPKADENYLPKDTILVEEDMEVVSDKENEALWKSDHVTPNLLKKVYHILHKFELLDCAKIDNIPFSKDGRIAFIDTQTFYAGDVIWEGLDEALNRSNRKLWIELTNR